MSVCEGSFVNYADSQSYKLSGSSTIVVSFCSKVSAVYEILKAFPNSKLFVVSKCGRRFPYTNISVDNVGRVDYSFLTYITRQYDDLSDTTLFIKDSWKRQHKDNLFSHIPHASLGDMMIGKRGFECWFQYMIWHDCRVLDTFQIQKYNKPWDSSTMRGVFKSRYTSFYEFHNRFTTRWKKAYNCPVCYGGVFAARKERIRHVPLASWKMLHKALERGNNIEESHFVERLWAMLLSDPLAPQIDRHMKSKTKLYSLVENGAHHTTGVLRSCLAPPHHKKTLFIILMLGGDVHSPNFSRPSCAPECDCVVYATRHIDATTKCKLIVRPQWTPMSFLRYTTPRITNSYNLISLSDGYRDCKFDQPCWNCIWSTIDIHALKRNHLNRILSSHCGRLCEVSCFGMLAQPSQ
jgi:hypothetical protein